MSERFITMPVLGEKFGGKSGRTAKHIAVEAGLPLYKVGGSVVVKESDVELWLETRRVETAQPDLRTRLQQIRDRVAAKRRAM